MNSYDTKLEYKVSELGIRPVYINDCISLYN